LLDCRLQIAAAAGRGIAVELGGAGATVDITGRSARERRSEAAELATFYAD
jgi:hypothetical protein